MSDVKKSHEYAKPYPYIATQNGVRQMTKKEHKKALAYHMAVIRSANIVESPKSLKTGLVGALCIAAATVGGFIGLVISLF